MMTEAELQAIETRCNEASVAPWHCDPWNMLPNGYLYGPAPAHSHKCAENAGLMKCHPPASFQYQDADFIAHARADVPALIAEIRQLQAKIKEIK